MLSGGTSKCGSGQACETAYWSGCVCWRVEQAPEAAGEQVWDRESAYWSGCLCYQVERANVVAGKHVRARTGAAVCAGGLNQQMW